MAVQLVDETYIPEPTALTEAPQERTPEVPPSQPQPQQHPTNREQVMRIMAAIATVMGFRLILAGAFLGALALGTVAVINPTIQTMIAASIYNLLVFLPTLYATMKKG